MQIKLILISSLDIMDFASRIITFTEKLTYTGAPLPKGIRVMNPYRETPGIKEAVDIFYRKYYADDKPRHFILGINPGRLGGGSTGIPFTDPKRLVSACHIKYAGPVTHEPSSAFVYDMIDAYGGVKKFYRDFYIHSVCPLGFTAVAAGGKEVNYNYYDSPALTKAVYPFIVENLQKQVAMGVHKTVCLCFGTGKNADFLQKLNLEYPLFEKIIPIEHPRYIMQYKAKQKVAYIEKYLRVMKEITG